MYLLKCHWASVEKPKCTSYRLTTQLAKLSERLLAVWSAECCHATRRVAWGRVCGRAKASGSSDRSFVVCARGAARHVVRARPRSIPLHSVDHSSEAEVLPPDPVGDRKPHRDGHEQGHEVLVVCIAAQRRKECLGVSDSTTEVSGGGSGCWGRCLGRCTPTKAKLARTATTQNAYPRHHSQDKRDTTRPARPPRPRRRRRPR